MRHAWLLLLAAPLAAAQQSPSIANACAGKLQDEVSESVALRARVLDLMAVNMDLQKQVDEAIQKCGKACQPKMDVVKPQ
jgi:hypothetical protein